MLLSRIYDRFMARSEARFGGPWRRELLAGLEGEVLEIGAGTGANLAFYPDTVSRLVVTEPDRHMRDRLHQKAPGVLAVDAPAERLPFPDASFDAAVGTLVLCSVGDPVAALAELRRVIRPGGRLVFLEHVASEDPSVRRWQRWADPVWSRVSGNCHLSRPTGELLVQAGFQPQSLRREAMPGAPRVVRETIRGVAHRD